MKHLIIPAIQQGQSHYEQRNNDNVLVTRYRADFVKKQRYQLIKRICEARIK